jgi:cbb3-type cytochrome oxidase maturation protein
MEVIYLLIPLGILSLGAAIVFFFWAVKSRQFDDLEGPAHRIIMDDREARREMDDRESRREREQKH